MLNTKDYLPLLKGFEGAISHFYLDTAGKVTVGVGNMIPSAAVAAGLGFVRRLDPGTSATAEEIGEDFASVASQMPGKPAGYYRSFTKLELPVREIDALLNRRVEEFGGALRRVFPGFDGWPESACAAVFDMAFNLGVHKLTSGFPAFCAAAGRGDWEAAREECHRGGIGAARNDWTAAQFEAAVSR